MNVVPADLNRVDLQYEEGEKFIEKATAQVAIAREYYREWVAAPLGASNMIISPDQGATPFPISDEARSAIQDFRALLEGLIYLDTSSGLPKYIACDFNAISESGEDPESQAEKLMQRFSLVFSGKGVDEVSVRKVWDITWGDLFDRTRHLHYVQNVWGGQIAFTFDSKGQLAVISNSLYPVSDDDLKSLERGDPNLATIVEILTGTKDGMHGVPENIGFHPDQALAIRGFVNFPYQPRKEREGSDTLWEYVEGEWRIPPFDRKSNPQSYFGDYRPAWIVRFIDKYEQPWLGFVDVVKYGLLHWSPLHRHASLSYAVFSTSSEAISFEAPFASGNDLEIQSWIDNQALKKTIWLGNNAQTLRQASRIHLNGVRLKDPEDNNDLPLVTLSERERYLAATIMYHARDVQSYFRGLMSQATIMGWINDQANPLNNLSINLTDEEEQPYYDPDLQSLIFPKGRAGALPVLEPGYDGEVIAHELTHAVMDGFFGHLFITNGTQEQETIAIAFDEGLAFYIACDYFDDAKWAEYAYSAWQPWRDITAISLNYDGVVDTLTNIGLQIDPSGVGYAIGMWWARVLWEFRQQFPAFNVVLLRTLYSLVQIQPTTQTSAASIYERIRDAFRIIGLALNEHLVQGTGSLGDVQSIRQRVFAILAEASILPL